MSRVDSLTGRGPSTGNNRSHSLRATRRRWNVNLQWYTITDENGHKKRIRVSTKTLRTLNKANKKVAPIAEPAAETPATEAPAAEAAPAETKAE